MNNEGKFIHGGHDGGLTKTEKERTRKSDELENKLLRVDVREERGGVANPIECPNQSNAICCNLVQSFATHKMPHEIIGTAVDAIKHFWL